MLRGALAQRSAVQLLVYYIRNYNRDMRRAKTLRAHRKPNEETNGGSGNGGFGLVGCVTDDGEVTFAIRSAGCT